MKEMGVFKISEVALTIKAYDKASMILGQVGSKLGIMNKQGIGMGIAFAGVNMAVGAAMSAFQGLMKWVGESITAFREFETSIAEVSTMLVEMEKEHIPALETGIANLSTKFGKSAIDMSKGMYQVLSASVDVSRSLEVLEVSTRAATAGLTTTETAVDALTTVMNAYGMTVSEASHISDVLFMTVKRGKIRFEDLAGTLGMAVPLAAQAGIKFEELAAAIASLTRQGINASKATMSLRQLISNLISPSVDAANAALDYGIVLNSLMVEIYGLEGMLNKLSDAAEGNLSVFTKFIPNIRALQAAMGLTGAGAQGFTNDIDLMENSIGATNLALKEIIDTGGFTVSRLKEMNEELDRMAGRGFSEMEIGLKTTELAMRNASMETAKFNKENEKATTAMQVVGSVFAPVGFLKAMSDMVMTLGNVSHETTKINEELSGSLTNVMSDIEQERQLALGNITVWDLNSDAASRYMKALKEVDAAIESGMQPADENLAIMKDTEEAFNTLSDEISKSKSDWDSAKAATALAKQGFDDYSSSALELETRIKDVLRPVAMMNMDMQRAGFYLKDTALAGDFFDSSFGKVVARLKESQSKLDEMTRSQQRYNIVSKETSIEMLKLQISGGNRRSGMNRREKRMMEDLQQSQLQNRLEQMQGDLELQNFKDNVYEKDRTAYEKLIDFYNASIVDLKGLRDEELDNAEINLKGMIISRNEYGEAMKIAYANEAEAYKTHMLNMEELRKTKGKAGINMGPLKNSWINNLPQNVQDWLSNMRSHQHGTPYVTETGPALLHRGERVVPAHMNRGGAGGGVFHVDPISVNIQIYNHSDLQSAGNEIGRLIASGLVSNLNSEFEVG